MTNTIVSSNGNAQYDLLRYEVDLVLRKEFRCPCPLSLYGGIRSNVNGSFVGYARWQIVSHSAMFQFHAFEVDEHIMAINVSSNLVMIKSHGVDIIKPFSPTRKTERNEMKKLLKYRSVRIVHLENNSKCDQELAADGHVDGAKNIKVLEKVKSEARCEGRLHLKSIDIEDAVQLWMEQYKLGNRAVRYFILPLHMLLFTEEQLQVSIESLIDFIHIDATSAKCRNPHFLKCKIIMYYALLFRGLETIIPIFEYFLSEHDLCSFQISIQIFRKFVIDTPNIGPIFKGVVTDWSWVFINGILFGWNGGMNIQQYLNLTWDIPMGIKNKPSNLICIVSCNAHILPRIAMTIDTDNEF